MYAELLDGDSAGDGAGFEDVDAARVDSAAVCAGGYLL